MLPLYSARFLVTLAALAVSLTALAGAELVIPEKPNWVIEARVDGKSKSFRLPSDLPLIKLLPPEQRNPLLDRITTTEENQKVTRQTALTFFSRPPDQRLTPDYERTLTEVAISISYTDANSPTPLDRHLPILNGLPDYTRIHVVGPTASEAAARKTLIEAGWSGRFVLHPTTSWNLQKRKIGKNTRPTRWIRDTFLVGAGSDGKATAFAPLAYANVGNLKDSDLAFLRQKWHEARQVIPLPVFVRGGNIAVGNNRSGARLTLIGADEINRNDEYFRHAAGLTPPSELLPAVIRQIAGPGTLMVLPNSNHLFHLDMAISFPGPGVVARISPIDPKQLAPDDAKVLEAIGKALADKGFRIIDIPTTTARINAYQSPVNAVPYYDKQLAKRRVMVPRFKDAEVTIDQRKQSLNAAIQRAYESAGFEVVWIDDRFSDRGGNLHCALLGLN